MQDDMRARPEWRAVVEAVEAGEDFGEALRPEHLACATEISIREDKVVTFVVERHPHLLGHQSLGESSTAYALRKDTYKYDPSSGASSCTSEHVKNVIDYAALAAHLVETFLECVDLDELKVQHDTPGAAERWAREVVWVELDEGQDLTERERKAVLEACVQYAVERITDH